MKESFVFYKSFMEAVKTIPEIKNRYLLLESIIELGLFSEKSEEKFTSFCIETERKLSKNSQVLGLFLVIKPQLFANYKKYMRKLKSKNTSEIKAPKKSTTNIATDDLRSPLMKMNNENENENVFLKEKEKENIFSENFSEKILQADKTEQDPFMSNKVHTFLDFYSKEFSKGKNAISREERIRLTNVLNDLEQQGYSIEEISETICRNLKKTKFRGIEGTFNPGINWLLKDNARNFYVTMNGQFVPSYDSNSDDDYEVDEYGN